MGNAGGTHLEEETDDLWWPKNEAKCEVNTKSFVCGGGNSAKFSSGSDVAETGTNSELSDENKGRLNEFKLELARKHEERRQLISHKRKEMDDLRAEVKRLKQENETLKLQKTSDEKDSEIERLKAENENLKDILKDKSRLLESSEELIQKNRELRINIAEMQKDLQDLNAEVLSFEKEREEYNAHVTALKDVISVSKNMLEIREAQLKELKEKVEHIEQSLAEREMNILSQDLRNEYERQLANIRSLRTLYQERSRIERVEREQLASQIEDYKKQVEEEQTKNSELQDRITELENNNSKKYDEVKSLESNLGLARAESRQYQSELAVINQLFSEIILGFKNTQNIDLDKLRESLEEHHDLLQEIVSNEISSEVSSALPKVLLDLVNNVKTNKEEGFVEMKAQTLEEIQDGTDSQIPTTNGGLNSVDEILENLPKVWKVLIELLSHQVAPVNDLTETDDKENPCYKTVQTSKGPSMVLSVSQTFIRLKDLILEKKSLEKETNHLKQLNGHLENRLQDQEKRLELVHTELSKTWHVVGKLQKQHQLLHTQEKILRYELAQKRKLLSELKEELEYSREKWTEAREKNSCTEKQWRELRSEFASRKKATFNDDINNSVESGYSDDRECSSDEEPGYETDISECAQRNTFGETKDIPRDDCDIIPLADAFVEQGVERPNTLCNETLDGVDISEQIDNNFPGHQASSSRAIDEDDAENTDSSILSRLADTPSPFVESIRELDDDQGETVDIDTSINPPSLPQQNIEIIEHSGTSTSRVQTADHVNISDILARRDERLSRLEGQAVNLVAQVSNTANRSVVISNRLDDLHEAYGNIRSTGHDVSFEDQNTHENDDNDF